MSIYWGTLPRPLAQVGPASSIMVEGVITRSSLKLPAHVAPSIAECLLVMPPTPTMDFVELFTPPWRQNPGRNDCYGACIEAGQVFVSMEGRYWVIEITPPSPRQKPALLGTDSRLVLTQSPMAAAEIVKRCLPTPVWPFEWISYH